MSDPATELVALLREDPAMREWVQCCREAGLSWPDIIEKLECGAARLEKRADNLERHATSLLALADERRREGRP